MMKNFAVTQSIACLIWLIALLVPSLLIAAENNVRFEHFPIKNGLSQQTVTTIFQDSKGFMWFGTQEGLNKYDGIEFTAYLPELGNSKTISSGYIYSITEDTQGNIWLGTTNGVSVLNRNKDNFDRHLANEGNNSLGDNIVYSVFHDSRGDIWAGTGNGLNKYNTITQAFEHFSGISEQYAKIKVRSIIETPSGNLLIATNDIGLLHLNTLTQTFKPITNANDQGLNLATKVSFIDDKNRLWVGTERQGIYLIDLQSLSQNATLDIESYKIDSTNDINILSITQDANGSLWIGSDDGLFYLDEPTKSFVKLSKFGDLSLIDKSIWSIFSDQTGVFWVGTFNGLHKWNSRTNQFNYYRENKTNTHNLSSNTITAIDSIDNLVFVGSFNGVDVINTNNGQVKKLPVKAGTQVGLNDIKILSILAIDETEIWFGYRFNGVSKYNKQSGEFKHYEFDETDPKSIGEAGILTIFQDNNNQLWFGTINGGLSKFNRDSDNFTRYTHEPNNPNTLSSDTVLSIEQVHNGDLWIGTWDAGISIYSPSTDSFVHIKANENKSSALASNTILSIHQDRLQNVWIGSQGGALQVLSAENLATNKLQFEKYHTANGMPSNVVYGILEDEQNSLWLSSNQGLSQVDISTRKIKNYRHKDGLQGDEFNSGAYHKAKDGLLYFGGNNGMTSFHPADLKEYRHAPKIEITKFRRLNNVMPLTLALNQENKIEVGYQDYLIGFDFAALDYMSPEDNQYRYKLLGFDSDWIDVRDIPRATYTNLPSGHYQFKVIAANSDNVWNKKGRIIDLVVHPAPWFSWWAYSFYILLGLLVCWRIIHNHRQKEALRLEFQNTLQQEVNQRTSELSEANAQLKEASFTDQLSGLYNRRYLSQHLPSKLDHIYRRFAQAILDDKVDFETGPRLMVLMLDLDGFKQINDTHGHEVGDKVIVQIASVLQRQCRGDDMLIRWGGDEFMVVAKVDNLQIAKNIAERIRSAIEGKHFQLGFLHNYTLTCSLGFAFYPFCHHAPQAISWDEVQLLADQALYKSKQTGRNTWSGFVQVENEISIKSLSNLSQDTSNALKNSKIRLIKKALT